MDWAHKCNGVGLFLTGSKKEKQTQRSLTFDYVCEFAPN